MVIMIMKLMNPELRFLVLGWFHRVNMKQSVLTTNRQWIKTYKLIKWLGARARVPLPFVVPSSLVLTLERRLVTILRVCMNFENKIILITRLNTNIMLTFFLKLLYVYNTFPYIINFNISPYYSSSSLNIFYIC